LKKPLISVVTVVRNGDRYIEDSILSVISQKSELYEYIIIDGNSNDRTIEIINRYIKKIDYFESSTDNGIFDAMNKGAAKANGCYLYFLNSDDYLMEGIFEKIDNFFSKLRSFPNIVYGNIIKVDGLDEFKCITPFEIKHSHQFYNLPIHHPGTIMRSDLFFKLKGFNTTYKYSADFDLFLRAFKDGNSFIKFNTFFSFMRAGGIGTVNLNKSLEEFYVSLKLNKFPISVRLLAKFRGTLVMQMYGKNFTSRALKKLHTLTVLLRHGRFK
jgi:glycosyltransferase involved in cell wall biosynthesis